MKFTECNLSVYKLTVSYTSDKKNQELKFLNNTDYNTIKYKILWDKTQYKKEKMVIRFYENY